MQARHMGFLLPLEFALENKTQDFFIVIASRNYCEEISAICKKAGLIENRDFVVPFEGG